MTPKRFRRLPWHVLAVQLCVILMGKAGCHVDTLRVDFAEPIVEAKEKNIENFSPSEHPNEQAYFSLRGKIYDLERQQSEVETASQSFDARILPSSYQPDTNHYENGGAGNPRVNRGKVTFDREAFKQHLQLEKKVDSKRQEIQHLMQHGNRIDFERFLDEWDEGIEESLTSLLRCLLGYDKYSPVQGRIFAERLAGAKAYISGQKTEAREELRTAYSDDDLDELPAIEAYVDAVLGQYSSLVFLVLEEASSHYKLDFRGFEILPIWFSLLLADQRRAVRHRTQALRVLLLGDVPQASVNLEKAAETLEGILKLRAKLSDWGMLPPDALTDPYYKESLKLWKKRTAKDNGLPTFHELELALQKLTNERKKLEQPSIPTEKKPSRKTEETFFNLQEYRALAVKLAIEAYEREQKARFALRVSDRVTALRELRLAEEGNHWVCTEQAMWIKNGLFPIKFEREPGYIEVKKAYEGGGVRGGSWLSLAQPHQKRARAERTDDTS